MESRRGGRRGGGAQLLSWSAGHGRRAHRGAGWRGSCKDTRGRAGEIGAEPGKLGQEERSHSSEEREHQGGGGAARAAETLGVTQASGTPRPLHSGLKESREPARRRRMVGVGTRVGYGGGGEKELPSFGAPSLAPRAFPLPSKARRLGVTGERKGKLRYRLAESWWPRPTPSFSGSSPTSVRPRSSGVPGLNLPGRETPGLETPPQPLTRAAVRPRGTPPAQSHLGQQDEQLLLAKGLGAAGTHAPLRRHGPAAPGLADLPLLPNQATGQCRHGAPGGDTPKPAGARSALGTPSPREARSLTRTYSGRSGPDSPPYPQDLRINPRGPPAQAPAPTLGPPTSFVGPSSLFTPQWTPPSTFAPYRKLSPSLVSCVPVPH